MPDMSLTRAVQRSGNSARIKAHWTQPLNKRPNSITPNIAIARGPVLSPENSSIRISSFLIFGLFFSP